MTKQKKPPVTKTATVQAWKDNIHISTSTYFENTCRVAGPTPQDPQGHIFVFPGEPRPVLSVISRPIYDATGAVDVALSSSQQRQLDFPNYLYPHTDNQIHLRKRRVRSSPRRQLADGERRERPSRALRVSLHRLLIPNGPLSQRSLRRRIGHATRRLRRHPSSLLEAGPEPGPGVARRSHRRLPRPALDADGDHLDAERKGPAVPLAKRRRVVLRRAVLLESFRRRERSRTVHHAGPRRAVRRGPTSLRRRQHEWLFRPVQRRRKALLSGDRQPRIDDAAASRSRDDVERPANRPRFNLSRQR
jgi:hypothetical protein